VRDHLEQRALDAERIAGVRTEREMSLVYEDLIGRVPLGKRLFADANPVREVQVRGTVWYAVPYLGWVNTWLTGERRAIVVPVIAGLLFAYAAGMVYSGLRDRKRARRRRERAAAQGSMARASMSPRCPPRPIASPAMAAGRPGCATSSVVHAS
jgi:hypothetical protein